MTLQDNLTSSDRTGPGYYTCRNQDLTSFAAWFLEYHFATPVIDRTGLTNRFDLDLDWDETDYHHPNLESLKSSLLDQLGLELVPDREPIEMLVVEKAK
jgi:uncharacterized protein (TIGR03435 family)